MVKKQRKIRAENAEKEKAGVLKRHPDATVTILTVFDDNEEGIGKAFLSAIEPPGSAGREDLKERFGIDLDENGRKK